jgi:hypothetical protein
MKSLASTDVRNHKADTTGVRILDVMTDERPNRTPNVAMASTSKPEPGRTVTSSINMGAESRFAAIREAVQELHDASVEEFRQLLMARISSSDGIRFYDIAEDQAVVDALVSGASARGLPRVAKLIRAGARFGIITIIAAIISAPVDHEVNDFMGWNPPTVQVVKQMSPNQLDQLARDIERQMEQWEQRQEPASHDRPGRKAQH